MICADKDKTAVVDNNVNIDFICIVLCKYRLSKWKKQNQLLSEIKALKNDNASQLDH